MLRTIVMLFCLKIRTFIAKARFNNALTATEKIIIPQFAAVQLWSSAILSTVEDNNDKLIWWD